jgi:hypothetical protein
MGVDGREPSSPGEAVGQAFAPFVASDGDEGRRRFHGGKSVDGACDGHAQENRAPEGPVVIEDGRHGPAQLPQEGEDDFAVAASADEPEGPLLFRHGFFTP